jgi:uncharacterized protein (TIRG00374 family)
MKPKIFFFIKCSISLLLIYWLVQKGELSMRNVALGLSNLKLVSIFLLLTFCQLFIGAVRTYLLMQFNTRSSFTLRRVLSITWASSFINCIAPSALFGEAFRVKELLTVDLDLNKDNTFYALGFSKIFSIFSLILITVAASLLVSSHPQEIEFLLNFLYIFVILNVFLYVIRNQIMSVLKPLFEKAYNLSRLQILQKRFDNFKQYHFTFLEEKKNFFWVVLLSLVIQILNTVSFLLIIYTINTDIDQNMLNLIYVVPLGIIAMTLPISISGLGVGHLAFSKLLGMFGIMNGADIFTIYFAYSYIFNLVGLVPFIILQKKR